MGRLNTSREAFSASGKSPHLYPQKSKSRLLVQAFRIVNRSGNSLLFEKRRQGIPVLYPDGVLGVDAGIRYLYVRGKD